MESLESRQRKQVGNLIVHVMMALLVFAVVGLVAWRVAIWHNSNKKVVSANVAASSATTKSGTSTTPTTNPTPVVAAGTDDTTLNNDLNNINGLLAGQSNDNSAVNASLNDSQNQITVPTN